MRGVSGVGQRAGAAPGGSQAVLDSCAAILADHGESTVSEVMLVRMMDLPLS